MKNVFLFLITVIFSTTSANAHYLWIETNEIGALGQSHEIRVYFGEYTYGVIEEVKGEAFPSVSKFKLWVVYPDGKKEVLEGTPQKDHYTTSFIPKQTGTYTVVLNNDEIDVIDYTQYDFGIFKTHYHSTAKVQIGKTDADTHAANPEGIVIKKLASDTNTVKLQVLYKDKPLVNHELAIYVADLWSKKLDTDENGKVVFALPWKTKYIVETTMKEEVPGTYKKESYQFIWHCATYCIKP
ncbi:MAG: DUF4198 domain-containing protein [Flavobacteriaceae bacterium]